MMKKPLLLALLTSGALVGLGGCSEGDEATINIDAPTTVNPPPTEGGGDPDPAPEPGPEPVDCPEGTTESAAGVCRLSGTYLEDLTLVAGNSYELDGRVNIGNGNCLLADSSTCDNGDALVNATLTIEPGVNIRGLPSDDPLTAAVLHVTRGSRINAVGTAAAPIIFSSSDPDFSGPGEWGGVQISGFAPHNACNTEPCNVDGEGEAGFIGGDDPADDSGIMEYVILAENGVAINSDGDEINALSLNAVGAGTTFDYIQIFDTTDDGVEFYGGTANMKHLVVANANDDSVDWDEGFQGSLQYVLVRQHGEGSGEAFEMDTEGTLEWLSKPTLVNTTIIADKQADDSPFIMRFKDSSGGFFHNTVVTVAGDATGFFDECARIEDGAEANINSSLVFNNWIQDCSNTSGAGGTLSNEPSIDNASVVVAAAQLDDILASQASAASGLDPIDWSAIEASFDLPSTANGDPIDFDASFFDATTFMGAVNPDGSDPWWAGWTLDFGAGNALPEPIEGCPEGTEEVEANVCRLSGTYTTDLTLSAGNVYQLDGRVNIGNGNCLLESAETCQGGDALVRATLTIQPGVSVVGLPSDDPLTASVLHVTRGSKINAIGTAAAPIVFSSADSDLVGPGEWGGVQISGFAPHNACDTEPCNVDGEGEAGFIGGDDAADDSGVMKYVILAENGVAINSDGDEINALSLNAVGSGTEFDFIQIYETTDDGVEFYGGTANMRHLVVANANDDSVDWDEGFQGNLQYVLVKQSGNGSGEAFEMDTEGTLEWLSKPTLVNTTIIADKQADDSPFIMRFKDSSAGFFHNVVITVADDATGTFDECARIEDGAEANINVALVFNNWVQDCANESGAGGTLSNEPSVGNSSIVVEAAQLDDILASQAAAATGLAPIDFEAIGNAYALPSTASGDPQDFDASFFDDTTFSGAVNPDGSDPWWAGWTIEGSL
ncbi:hypothetical protein HRUBRA_01107 [Pseudohaliea rubra DSM 19751]|uniref:Lipoprotein n=2 Tax=Pseudohaliea TaxID=1341120 RepID=A0A095VT29_9GAMM|nr:hypothetical protein HRUBRA_01107 [Pseudohaliea rubra DSM 19751]